MARSRQVHDSLQRSVCSPSSRLSVPYAGNTHVGFAMVRGNAHICWKAGDHARRTLRQYIAMSNLIR